MSDDNKNLIIIGVKMFEINGKIYPLWNQFVEQKNKFIGGILQDFGDSMDQYMGCEMAETEIINIILRENGRIDAWFEITGKDFNCGFSTEVGGITGGEDGWLTFSGYGDHSFRIKQPQKIEVE